LNWVKNQAKSDDKNLKFESCDYPIIDETRYASGNESDQMLCGIDGAGEFLLERDAPNRVLVLQGAPMTTPFLSSQD
jgi:hypothetical protein